MQVFCTPPLSSSPFLAIRDQEEEEEEEGEENEL